MIQHHEKILQVLHPHQLMTAEITDTLKSMIYAKAGEKIDGMKGYAAASLFGQEPEEPTAEVETEVDQEPEEEEDA